MKNYRLKLVAVLFGIVGFFALMGVMGRLDYCEDIILRMSYDDYDYVKDTLTKRDGHSPSEREIALWWADHHNEIP